MPKSADDIEDLVDFYKCWPKLRGDMRALQAGNVVSAEQAVIIRWMGHLIDRVGPADLETEREP